MEISTIRIERIGVEAVEELQNIGRTTFSQTFASSNTEENMRIYLDNGFSLEKLKGELSNTDSTFYFAYDTDRVIGYLKVNFGMAQTELQDTDALEIERIYVLREYQGQKVGQHLFNKAIEIAQAHQLSYVWLGVWEQNYRAVHFYKKNGFVPFDQHIFKMGNEQQTDVLMKLQLV